MARTMSTRFSSERLMKLVSTMTRYGGTRASLCAKKSDVGIVSLRAGVREIQSGGGRAPPPEDEEEQDVHSVDLLGLLRLFLLLCLFLILFPAGISISTVSLRAEEREESKGDEQAHILRVDHALDFGKLARLALLRRGASRAHPAVRMCSWRAECGMTSCRFKASRRSSLRARPGIEYQNIKSDRNNSSLARHSQTIDKKQDAMQGRGERNLHEDLVPDNNRFVENLI